MNEEQQTLLDKCDKWLNGLGAKDIKCKSCGRTFKATHRKGRGYPSYCSDSCRWRPV